MLTTSETYVDDDGKIAVRTKMYPVRRGHSYNVAEITEHGGFVDIVFPEEGPILGIATNVESAYCELGPAKAAASSGRGCGGCGSK